MRGEIMFHVFESQEARRAYGGSAFLEWQYCRMKPGTSLKRIVSMGAVRYLEPDSLYVHVEDLETFTAEYGSLICGGVYNNRETGPVDVCGINYYSPEAVKAIRAAIKKEQPEEYPLVLEWLERAEAGNGFYIQGL